MLKRANRKKGMIDGRHDLTQFGEEEQRQEIIPHEHSHRKVVFLGTICTVILAATLGMISNFSSSEGSAEEMVANRISKSTAAGETVFTEETNSGISARDFEVTLGDSGGEAKMLIWDFNSEDNDEVQILINGQLMREKLILAHNPAALSIPVPSTVTVKGLKDNGAGISYAVKFPNDKVTYYNVVSVNSGNTYTVKPL
ncbi:hypothetical protein [Exiguobacterium flavidum]|uniref:hypothetical protein n=1 Tax=Exiguobacterium flavidum TaxID=2184695 RepID=UPI000DF786D0|nr:hypothetical protein [Exiguobacterium flavidum]